MNLNKTGMIMVIIPTNNIALKLLYLWFHFQNLLKTGMHELLSFTWEGGESSLTSFSGTETMVQSIFGLSQSLPPQSKCLYHLQQAPLP